MLLRYRLLYLLFTLWVHQEVVSSMKRIVPRINKSTLLGSISMSYRNFSATQTHFMKVTPKLYVYKSSMPVEDAQKLLKVSQNLTFKELNDKSFVASQKVQQAYQQGMMKQGEFEAMMQSLKEAYDMLHSILKASVDYEQQRHQGALPQQMVRKQELSERMQQKNNIDREDPWKYQQEWVAHEQMYHAYQGTIDSHSSLRESVVDSH